MVSGADEPGGLKPLRLFLLGFMGAGKSTAGRLLAKDTGWPFYDMDDLIEEREDKKIEKIFRVEGEEYFRDLETELLRELSSYQPPVIVSCGGGVPLRQENRDLMAARGVPVYLHVTPEEARERIGNDPNRPLFSNGEEGFNKVKRLWENRQEVYNKIQHRIESGPPDEQVEKIKQIVHEHAQEPTGNS